VEDASLFVSAGETLGVVGESGCGKSTLARMIIRLIEPDAGSIRFDGVEIAHAAQAELRSLRRRMQMVFQDPYGSLNPRMRAGDAVAEPLRVHRVLTGSAIEDRVADLFRKVGLRPDQLRNRPSQFSGGQRQRLAIARALALDPELIVADEPVSALDVSIQAQIVNLLRQIQAERRLAYLFISHDLRIVRHISNRIAVMYLGRIVETGATEALFRVPGHPYTQMLLEAIPRPDPRRRRSSLPAGEVPSSFAPPSGCPFHPRCPRATAICRVEMPAMRQSSGGTEAACHHAG
jgi:oligopeptide/dipeptide ABC transporter ATP-binding protein